MKLRHLLVIAIGSFIPFAATGSPLALEIDAKADLDALGVTIKTEVLSWRVSGDQPSLDVEVEWKATADGEGASKRALNLLGFEYGRPAEQRSGGYYLPFGSRLSIPLGEESKDEIRVKFRVAEVELESLVLQFRNASGGDYYGGEVHYLVLKKLVDGFPPLRDPFADDPAEVKNAKTGFWLSSDLKLTEEAKRKRLAEGVTATGDYSSYIRKLNVDAKENHWSVRGTAEVKGRQSRTCLFVGKGDLAHGQRIVPIAMPDRDGRFSFEVAGMLSATMGDSGITEVKQDRVYPSCLYIGAIGQRVLRVKLDELVFHGKSSERNDGG